MRTRYILLAAAVAAAAGAVAVVRFWPNPLDAVHSDAPDGPIEICGETAATVGKLRAKIAATPDIERLRTATEHYTAFAQNDVRRIWAFTTGAHPAHPSVVCRTIVPRGSGSELLTDVHCTASRGICDDMVRDFMKVNERLPPG